MSEIENFYNAGNRKINRDKDKLLAEIGTVRIRLENKAIEVTENYRKSCNEASLLVEDSYHDTIQPFWKRIISSGVGEKILSAGYEGRGAQITDITNYDWPEWAEEALDKGGRYPDSLDYEKNKELKEFAGKPCFIDAVSVVTGSVIMTPKEHEETILYCYEGKGRGLTGLAQNGLSIHRLWEGDSRAYPYQGLRYYFNPSEDALPPIPDYIHPRLINDFAIQIRSGLCEEYIGALLVRAEEKERR